MINQLPKQPNWPKDSVKLNFSELKALASAKHELKEILGHDLDPEEFYKLISNIKNRGISQINKDLETFDALKEQIRAKIEAKEMEYLTRGQEWEVYKIALQTSDGKSKEFIIIKQRYDQSNVSHEAQMFERAYTILNKETKTWLVTPQFYGVVTTKDHTRYLTMEYIKGKTLYTLQLEKICDYFQQYYPETRRFFQSYYDAEGNINFENDTKAEDALIDWIRYLDIQAQNFAIKNERSPIEREIPKIFTDYPIGRIRLNEDSLPKMLKIIYETMMNQKKVRLFTSEEVLLIIEKLSNGLDALHKKGFYHRDIGGNPRNLMLRKGSDNEREPVLIDFGKSIYNPQFSGDYDWGKGPYVETGLPWEFDGYVPDQNILSRIKWSQIISETDEELFRKEQNEYLASGTILSRYCNKHFLKIKEDLALKMTTIPPLLPKQINVNSPLQFMRRYIEISMIEWGTQKSKQRKDTYRSHGYCFALLDYDKEEKKLLITANTEKNFLQLLMQLNKDQFDLLYSELKEQQYNARMKKKVYVEYFLSFFEYFKQAFE